MPQMSPMSWFKLLSFFIMLIILLMILINNLFIYKNLKEIAFKIKKIEYINKW